MEASRIKIALIAAFLCCIALVVFTCKHDNKAPLTPDTTLQDTIFLSQWRREKAEKLQLMVQYHSEIAKLQKSKDSLQKIVSEKKIAMSAYRFKINYFQKQLKEALEKKDSTQLVGDSILPIVDSLFLSQKQNDTSCDETIEVLQSIVANRDSSIEFQKSIEINLKELQLEQELKNQSLTAQLNKAFKDQRKKTRQNKLLSGGLLILTGITTSLLISNSLK